MINGADSVAGGHSHVFLGERHRASERRTWAVIWLCAAAMLAEIVGGWLFGSIALVADGFHMSTHVGALLLAALAYTFARRFAHDERFTFGTGKFGDLAGYTNAILLGMIALLIGYEAVSRLFAPAPIHYAEALPIAFLGLAVNIASAWLLGASDHGHAHGAAPHDHDASHTIATKRGEVVLEIYEDGAPPRFRVRSQSHLAAAEVSVATLRPNGERQTFRFVDRDGFLESVEEIPEPHEFKAEATIDGAVHSAVFEEHQHVQGAAAHDNNMRAAVVHVIADAAVSVLVILALALAWAFGWRWTDPAAGVVGALVIASWAVTLIRDTGAVLVDMNPDRSMTAKIRGALEQGGDRLADLHLWRLGPGCLGAIVSVVTTQERSEAYFRAKLARFRSLTHLTIEVRQAG